ncbi:inosine triphosphate pyrophosphatase [Fadolivirus algeromassiliense]|jgi:inosine triphosphate pyrophosphatase|uniref:Inosine triphosphate pyrophosphatase n=1 Tax=Fadolivirus FV1/VV64 TaxID=3070911 RepID=A0A7D3R0C8_9VIRU|nr:inosine triphosphate pyrophosphatase [Fadolivirus algeromassiliense]QKF93582.1 inosine triphosphate pyrophosphatase [Fadolivirus FV1/VV64]
MSQERKKIYFVTGNKNKFAEAKSILDNDHVELVQYNIDLSEYQGDMKTIAIKKCHEAHKILETYDKHKYPLIIEDTSLCFNGMGGMPGPYIKWFLSSIGPDGLVKMIDRFDDRTAQAVCCVSYMENESSDPKLFVGMVNGMIVPARGKRNFGWDPIFQPLESDGGNGQTYAEMDDTYKNQISHRYKALEELKKYLTI